MSYKTQTISPAESALRLELDKFRVKEPNFL